MARLEIIGPITQVSPWRSTTRSGWTVFPIRPPPGEQWLVLVAVGYWHSGAGLGSIGITRDHTRGGERIPCILPIPANGLFKAGSQWLWLKDDMYGYVSFYNPGGTLYYAYAVHGWRVRLV